FLADVNANDIVSAGSLVQVELVHLVGQAVGGLVVGIGHGWGSGGTGVWARGADEGCGHGGFVVIVLVAEAAGSVGGLGRRAAGCPVVMERRKVGFLRSLLGLDRGF